MLHTTRTGNGPPLILLHPVGLSSVFWPVLVERMKGSRTVIAVDTSGHGSSPDAARPGRMVDRVTELISLMESLEIRSADILGVSFGGMIAMQLALARPDLVRSLILAACPPEIPEAGREGILERGRAAETGGMAAVLDDTLTRWFTPSFMSTDAVARIRDRLLQNDPSNWAAAWEAVAEHDALDRLKTVRAPTLVVAGEADAATPLAAKHAIANAIPDSRLEILAGAPHMLQIERADDFADLVSGFLAGLES